VPYLPHSACSQFCLKKSIFLNDNILNDFYGSFFIEATFIKAFSYAIKCRRGKVFIRGLIIGSHTSTGLNFSFFLILHVILFNIIWLT
jgi:hypothetical protein